MKTATHHPAWFTAPRLRLLLRWSVLLLCLILGIRFGLFVRHFETFGQAPFYTRPPGVEGFLPIGALVSLKYWVTSGQIDPVHPAALVLFVTFLALALVARNAFCSWICPVGLLEDWLWKAGGWLPWRLRVWGWLDTLLRGGRYLLLLFFVKLVLIDMPAAALQGFLATPYWAVADVKMLHFFTAPSPLSLGIIAALAVLSVVYRNVWCRYLCPYGALLGLLGWFAPFRVRRDPDRCIDCRRCTELCPGLIRVHQQGTVHSLECTACLTCVANCPVSGALTLRLPWWQRPLPEWSFALLVVAVFGGGMLTGMLSGHWQTVLTYEDYRQLIPYAGQLGH